MVSGTNHRENHLGTLQPVGLAGDRDFSLSFEHLRERIKGSGVLGFKPWPSSQANRATLPVAFLTSAAGNGTVLVADKFQDIFELTAKKSIGFGWSCWFHRD